MGFVLLVIAAFSIGAAGIVGVQHLGLLAVKQSLHANHAGSLPAKVAMPVQPAFKFDQAKFRGFTAPKLDPNIGKNIPIGTFNRQIDLHIRAGNMVPRPPSVPRIPGMRRGKSNRPNIKPSGMER